MEIETIGGVGQYGAARANVTTSAAFYAQSSALATVLAHHGLAPPLNHAFHEDPDDIHAIEASLGGTVDTLA